MAITIGSQNGPYNSGSNYSCYLDSTHLIAITGTSAKVGTIASNGTISFGSATTLSVTPLSIWSLDSTHFIVVYDGSDNVFYFKICTVSGSTISEGSGYNTNCNYSNSNYGGGFSTGSLDIVALSSSLFVFSYIYYYSGGYSVFVRAASVSGTSISFGTTQVAASEFGGTQLNSYCSSLVKISSTQFALAGSVYLNTTYNNACIKIGTVSGTTITLGSSPTISALNYEKIKLVLLDSSHLLWVELCLNYYENLNYAIYSFSNTTLTYVSGYTLQGTVTNEYLNINNFDATSWIAIYKRSSVIKSKCLYWNGSTFTFDSDATLINNNTYSVNRNTSIINSTLCVPTSNALYSYLVAGPYTKSYSPSGSIILSGSSTYSYTANKSYSASGTLYTSGMASIEVEVNTGPAYSASGLFHISGFSSSSLSMNIVLSGSLHLSGSNLVLIDYNYSVSSGLFHISGSFDVSVNRAPLVSGLLHISGSLHGIIGRSYSPASPHKIQSSGTASHLFLNTPYYISLGSETVPANAAVTGQMVAALDSTHFVQIYRSHPDNYRGRAVIGTVSGTTITYGSVYVVDDLYPDADNYKVVALDSTHFVATWTGGITDTGYYSAAKLGTVSGTTISWSSTVGFNYGTSLTIDYTAIEKIDANTFVVAFRDSADSSYGHMVVGSTSSGNIQFGTEYTYDSTSTGAGTLYPTIKLIDASTFVIVYQRNTGTSLKAKVGLISGTSISFGSEYPVTSLGSNSWISVVDTHHFFVNYHNGSNYVYRYCTLGSSDQSIISVGSEQTPTYPATGMMDFSKLYLSKLVGVNGSNVYIADYSSTYTTNTAYAFNASTSNYTNIAVLDLNKFVIGYSDAGNSNYPTAVVGKVDVWYDSSISGGLKLSGHVVGLTEGVMAKYDGSGSVYSSGHSSSIFGLSYSASGSLLTSSSVSVEIERILLTSGTIQSSGNSSSVLGISFSSSGSLLSSGNTLSTVSIERGMNGSLLLSGSASQTFELSRSTSGSISSAGFAEYTLILSFVSIGGIQLSGFGSSALNISRSMDGSIVFSGSNHGTSQLTYQPSGNIVLSGSYNLYIDRNIQPNGSCTINDSSIYYIFSKHYIKDASGVISLYGTAATEVPLHFYDCSGLITLSSNVETVNYYDYINIPSGVVSVSGLIEHQFMIERDSSGGIVLSGEVEADFGNTWVGSGLLELSGGSVVQVGSNYVSSGGFVLSSETEYEAFYNNLVSVGGMIYLSGSAEHSCDTYQWIMNGYVVLSGSASFVYSPNSLRTLYVSSRVTRKIMTESIVSRKIILRTKLIRNVRK